MKKILAVLAMCGILAACTPPQEITVAAPTYINIQVPASLMRDCNIPIPPSREYLVSLGDEAQSVVAAWTLEMHGALETCASRQDGLARVVRNYQAEISRLNAEAEAAQN